MKTAQIATKFMVVVLTGMLCSGCYFLQKTKIPVESISYAHNQGTSTPADDLFILLPGLGDKAAAFERRGMVRYMRESGFADGLTFDLVAVNAHFKYYTAQTLIERLKSDIVDPAKATGYKRIHFIGISLGGFGSLLYLREYPEEIATVTLLAPYLGEEEYYQHLLDENFSAPDSIDKKNIWPWLETLPDTTRDKIFLGYGDLDKFVQAHAALAALLSAAHTITVAGKHRWTTWEQLWPGLLAKVKDKSIR
jgi:pimeloyl-ACP methyl ester carboxylesterase